MSALRGHNIVRFLRWARGIGSQIDPSYPIFGEPETATVRRNFATAAQEISALQNAVEEFLDIGTGPQGPAGPANNLTVGSTVTGAANTLADVTITGAAPNQTLHFTIPRGIQGDPGVPGLDSTVAGPPGPATNLTVSGTTTGAAGTGATVSISGTAPNQILSFTIPRGDAGQQGVQGPPGLAATEVTAPLTGAGTTASPLALTLASAAEVTAGTNALRPVTPLTLRGVTGNLANLQTTDKADLVAAINEVEDTLANLDLGVTTNTSLLGDGRAGVGNELRINPATTAEITAATPDNIKPVSPLGLRGVTGNLAQLATSDDTNLVASINEIVQHIATLQSGVTPIGTYDVTTDVVTPFSGSPFGATPGPLPAAAAGNKGWYAIVSPNVGTGLGTSEIAGVTVAIGDQLLSSGTSWDHIVLSAATTPASSVAIAPIAGMTASTAQQALAELHTNKLATVAVNAPITGNGAGTPLGLSVAGAGDVATGTNNTLPITSATLRGVTGDPAGLTTTVTTNLIAALNGLQTEVDAIDAAGTLNTVDDAVVANPNQATPTQLTAQLNVVTGDGGVRLPVAIVGGHCFVRNNNTNPIEVYPAATAAINDLAAGAALLLDVRTMALFKASSAVQWYSM